MTRLFAGTDWDRPPRCERCGKPEAECECSPSAKPPALPSSQTARIKVERRKRGKVVTVVDGLSPEDNDLSALLTQLKTHCGAGGTLKVDQLEIQGDHLQRIQQALCSIGYRVK